MPAQFHIHGADPQAVEQLCTALDLPRFVAATLVSRGVDTPEKARQFMTPSLDRDWLNPYDIDGLSAVADLLEKALDERLHVVVYGDFDLDGISATTVLTRGIRALGGRATPFIPKRFDEGYGITDASIERLQTLNPDVVVTVDCGISCKNEVAKLTELGMAVAVTDHHEASDSVPVGVPVADPKMRPDCESSILAGVGVALKLVQILGARRGYPHLWRSYTDFATLGTVADLMPMRGENRALVAEGIERINQDPRPCIAALIATCGVTGPLTASNLSFSLVPRLNAAGRMGDAQPALDLLMCDNYPDALLLAQKLEEVNNSRRAIEAELSVVAKEQAEQTYDGERVLVVSGQGWHEGVKGIVASRLVNIYGVPSLLFTIEGDEARGSGRSVGSVNLFAAVESTADLLTRFGGHEAAVGVTLPAKNLPEFTRRLNEWLLKLPEDDFHPMIEIDAKVQLSELTLPAVEMLDKLAPFGQENPVPVYMASNISLINKRPVGADKNHFSCTLTDGRALVNGIMFHCGTIEDLLDTECVVNAAFSVQVDEWRGRRNVKAMVQELSVTRCCGALEACLDHECAEFFSRLFADEGPSNPETQDAEKAAVYQQRQENRRRWQALAAENPAGLEEALVHAIIGPDGRLHASQKAVLDSLNEGHSVLAIMATGRGKSLIFQVHAAKRALVDGLASVFVYPLRALIADQAYHIKKAFEAFGLVCAVLTGESNPEERQEVYQGVGEGTIDIVLTTPEFLEFHAKELGASQRIGFMVVDEAHHIGLAHAGQRPSYNQLGAIAHELGAREVLAVTATAPSEITSDITAVLPVQERIVDETPRTNLYLDDQRGIRGKDEYLASLVARGEKTVIYVNSREQSVMLARQLRRRVPQMAPFIGFYNAGLTRAERSRIERLFRQGDILVLVATSAFGEGVDIPDIRHGVLYHMPFNEVEFNQMAGRAGRDGLPATVHLLYGRSDASINEQILANTTPDHDCMASLYRHLRALQRQQPGAWISVDANALRPQGSSSQEFTGAAATCGLAVFRELGLIEMRVSYNNAAECWAFRINEGAPKVQLTDSIRYAEGLGERQGFAQFCSWALECDPQTLQIRVCHPIVPHPPTGPGFGV